MITLENVSKIYPSKKQTIVAVDDVSLTIDAGTIFGIIGYSGAGKSTILRMLNFLEQPTHGKVIIEGADLGKFTKKELLEKRREIGMIFQHFNLLWSRTVLENITLPLEISGVPKSEQMARAMELIHLVGLEGREHAYPSELSGGQKQRVGIARALSTNPKILLADEATSALDPETTSAILALLQKINRELGVTIVLITHQMDVIKEICHNVAVMENGKVVESGKVFELFSNPQHPTTKRFVQQIETADDISDILVDLKAKHPEASFLELTFLDGSADQPILNLVAKSTDASFSIIHGTITQTTDDAFGRLIIQISGEPLEVVKAQKILDTHHVNWSVL